MGHCSSRRECTQSLTWPAIFGGATMFEEEKKKKEVWRRKMQARGFDKEKKLIF